MSWSVVEVTAPPVEPVTLAEARAHLRQEVDAALPDDALVAAQIRAAREWVEAHIGYATIQRQLRLTLDRFPAGDTIDLPRSRLISIDKVEYVDRNGDTQTWASANYAADTASEEGRLLRGFGVAWPGTRAQRQAVMITYTAGWPAVESEDGGEPDYAANVPQPIKAAMLLLIGHWYLHREAVITGTITAKQPLAVEALLAPYRRMYL